MASSLTLLVLLALGSARPGSAHPTGSCGTAKSPSSSPPRGNAHDHIMLPLPPMVNPQAQGGAAPATNLSFNYGHGDSLVNVNLAMRHPAVLLEEMAGIGAVSCTTSSVAVTFSNRPAFDEAVAAWTHTHRLVFVTNHLGDCDAELDRGFFLADEFQADGATLTIQATTERKDVASTATYTEITFANLPTGPAGAVKRDLDLVKGLTISENITVPDNVAQFTVPGRVAVKTHRAMAAFDVTMSGHVAFEHENILDEAGGGGKLKALWFDLDVSMTTDLLVEVDLMGTWGRDFKYTAPPLAYNFLNVPGIMRLGPALHVDVGLHLAVNGTTKVTADVGSSVQHASVHLDAVDWSKTNAVKWSPIHTYAVNITERAAVHVDPFFDVSASLDFQLLGGLLDLSSGVAAHPRFSNEFALPEVSELDVGDGTTVQFGGADACAQDLAVKSSFDFSVDVFATQWWKQTLYKVSVPLAKACYAWGPE